MIARAVVIRRYSRPVALFVLGVLLAAAALVWREHARRPHYVVTVEKLTDAAQQIPASDCPVDVACVTTGASLAFVGAVMASFPGSFSGDLSHAALAGPTGPWAETVDLRTSAGVQVRVTSRCMEHGSAARADQSPSVPAVGPATVFVVVPGRPGCSVGVVLAVPTGVSVPWTAATTLAHRRELQLQP